MAAMIIMISSNERATGVNATRLFFSLNTPCYYHFLSPSHTHTHMNTRLITCNSLPITALSSCPVTGPGGVDKGATTPPKKKKNQGNTKEPPPLWYRRGRRASDEVWNFTCTLWLSGQRCGCFLSLVQILKICDGGNH